MNVRNLSKKALVVFALCAVSLIVVVGFALKLNSIVQSERANLDQKRLEYVRQLEELVGQHAQAEDVVRLLGRESKLSSSEAKKTIQQHAPSRSAGTDNLWKVDRWPAASFYTDGDFTFVVFFDSDGRIKDFVIGNQ